MLERENVIPLEIQNSQLQINILIRDIWYTVALRINIQLIFDETVFFQ